MTVIFVYRNYQGIARTMKVDQCRDPEATSHTLADMLDAEVAWKAA